MRPTKCKLHAVLFRQRPIASVAINLQDAGKASKMRDRLFRFSVLGINIDRDRWIDAPKRPVVARIGPKLASLCPAAARIEHRRPRLIGEDFRGRSDVFQEALVHGPQMPGGAANPVGERRTVERDPLPGVDLRLAVERQMIGVFGDQHMGDCRLGWQAALDQSRRSRRLHDAALAGPACIFGTMRHQHPELRRNNIQPLGDILPYHVQQALAARAGFVLDVDGRLDARQMSGKRAAITPALARGFRAHSGRAAFFRRRNARLGLLDILQRQQHLVFRESFGPAAKTMALHLLDDLNEALVTRTLRKEQRLELVGVVRKRVDRLRHE